MKQGIVSEAFPIVDHSICERSKWCSFAETWTTAFLRSRKSKRKICKSSKCRREM